MRTVKNSKLPFASDMRSALTPVCVLVRVTLASADHGAGAVANRADDSGRLELRQRGACQAEHKQREKGTCLRIECPWIEVRGLEGESARRRAPRITAWQRSERTLAAEHCEQPQQLL